VFVSERRTNALDKDDTYFNKTLSPVTTAWRVHRLYMEQTASRQGEWLKIRDISRPGK
jgi:hypothetical protein